MASLRGRRLWLGGAALLVTLPALAFVVALSIFTWRKGPPAGTVELDIVPHASADELAEELTAAGLSENRTLMALYLRLAVSEDDVIPGPHLLQGGMTPSELRDLLIRAASRPKRKITIPEGFNRFQIASRLEELGITGRTAFLGATTSPELLRSVGIPGPDTAGAEPPTSAEGYLFPATYELLLDSPPDDVVRRLVGEARSRWDRLAEKHDADLNAVRAQLGWGRREVMILASMIEKEAAVDEERSVVSSVFMNRLTDPSFTPKRLESDPTSAYGCLEQGRTSIPSCARFDGKVTPAMNRDKANRYSTYVNEGLPPGPISNPGERSIEAAMAPALTRYFFFVAKGGGRHTFSETLEDHQRAIHGGK